MEKGGQKHVDALNSYYKEEYERIVNRFIWNASGIFYSDSVNVALCYREAKEEVQKLTYKAQVRQDMTGHYHIWAMNTIERKYKEIKH